MLRILDFIRNIGFMMAHPDWALKFKTKGTELRNINGRYYLYRISSRWDKDRKVTRKITHEMLGTITEVEGLIAKGVKRAKSQARKLYPLSAKEYGATNFLQSIGSDIFKHLAIIFPEIWREIAILAMNRLIYQVPLKNNEFLHNESFLSESYNDISLDKNYLTFLMKELGNSRDKIATFLNKFIPGNKNIIFDSTNIFSVSEKMKTNAIGYNSKKRL